MARRPLARLPGEPREKGFGRDARRRGEGSVPREGVAGPGLGSGGRCGARPTSRCCQWPLVGREVQAIAHLGEEGRGDVVAFGYGRHRLGPDFLERLARDRHGRRNLARGHVAGRIALAPATRAARRERPVPTALGQEQGCCARDGRGDAGSHPDDEEAPGPDQPFCAELLKARLETLSERVERSGHSSDAQAGVRRSA